MSVDEFRSIWATITETWARLRSDDPGQARALLAELLRDGVDTWSDAIGSSSVRSTLVPEATQESALDCAMELITLADAFDTEMYVAANPRSAAEDKGPLHHYCRVGWRRARNPTRDFDVWWYVTEYLDPAAELVDPLLHYLLVGRRTGLSPLPPFPTREPFRHADGASIRRICLFAAYDVDGIVDDYVVAYLAELSRHADVYFLADGPLEKDQLARLADVTVGAWAIRHGEYDFGSYSRLARDLVGWDVIETYDELLLVNDSCYLVRPLDEVFARMDVEAGHWWGMQLTAPTYAAETSAELPPLPLDRAKAEFQQREIATYHHFAHVGSYFLVFRRPVIADAGFRRRLDAVCRQESKLDVIFKYETGTTRYLVGQGYDFTTYVPDLLPFHPAYSAAAFTLIERGFPLLKRQLLAENPFDVPDLSDWKLRLRAAAPGVDVEMLDRNLHRVAADDKLQRAMAVRTAPDGSVVAPRPLGRHEFRLAARESHASPQWWAFVVRSADGALAGGVRAVFEEVRHDPSVTKVVLTGARHLEVDGANVLVAPQISPEAQQLLLRCQVVLLEGAPHHESAWPLPPRRYDVVSLWRTVAMNDGSYATPDGPVAQPYLDEQLGRCRAVAAPAGAVLSTTTEVWPVGAPGHDLLVRSLDQLPDDLRTAIAELPQLFDDRPFAALVPARTSVPTTAQVEALGRWLERHDLRLGVREHPGAYSRPWFDALADLDPVDLGWRRFPELATVIRSAAAIVTDDAVVAADVVAAGRTPVDIGLLEPDAPLPPARPPHADGGSARRLVARLRNLDAR